MTNPTTLQPATLWPQHAHDAANDIAALSKTVLNIVTIAAGLVGGRRRIDVKGLDRIVGLLCAKALDLPPASGRASRAGLVALLTEVDLLSLALRSSG